MALLTAYGRSQGKNRLRVFVPDRVALELLSLAGNRAQSIWAGQRACSAVVGSVGRPSLAASVAFASRICLDLQSIS